LRFSARLQSILAALTLALAVFLLPMLEFLEANPYFKFRYGFDESLLGLVLVVFAVVPFGLLALLAWRPGRPGARPRRVGMMLGLVLFASQLYSTTLQQVAPWIRFAATAAVLGLGSLVVVRRSREALWSLALAAVLVAPWSAYNVLRAWWRIPHPPSPARQADVPVEPGRGNIYIFLIDGCTVTSEWLDERHYPRQDLFPEMHRLVSEDSHWFYNAVSNGPSTSSSLPSMLTGKLYSARTNHYLADEPTIFSLLQPYYRQRIYLHTKSCFCIGENFSACFPFLEQSHAEPLRVLGESWAFLSSFRRSPMSFAIGKLDEANYDREVFVSDYLQRVAEDEGSSTLYAIQLFDRRLEGLQTFDRFLGEVRSILERRGLYDDAVIVLTSDHGYNLEGDEVVYGEKAAKTPRLFRVPLAIKPPGRGHGAVYDYPAQGIDLLPTLLGLTLPDGAPEIPVVDGVDVLKSRPPRRHYFNLLVPGKLFQLPDATSASPNVVAVPVGEVTLRGSPRRPRRRGRPWAARRQRLVAGDAR
jgi:hypothetical protein